jgi:hypothetical protein
MMAASQYLMVGGGDAFVPARGCPVAMEKYGNGQYFPHHGDSSRFFAGEVRVRDDDSATIRLAVWRCVYCGVTLVGIGNTYEPEVTDTELTWFEEHVNLIGGPG